MDDIITIEECITRLDVIRHEIVPDSRDHFAISAGIAALYEMEQKAPAVNRWIPCSERLPEKDKSYITYAETTKYCTHNEIPEELRINVLYFNGEEWYDEECIYYNVTHYMPLPEPPEKE
jgi:hypothetical protein